MSRMSEEMNVTVQEKESNQEHVDLAICRKEISRVGLWFFLGALWIEGLQIGVLLLFQKCFPQYMENGNISLIVQMLPMYAVGMPLLMLALSKLPAVVPKRKKVKFGYLLAAIPMSYTVMQAGNFVGVIITSMVGAHKGVGVENVMVDLVTSISPWLRLVVMVICAPIFEETIFRKMLVSRTLKYGEGVSVFLSGWMFGLFHGNLNQFAYAFVLGCFLAFIYVKSGNIKITIGLHMFVNFIGGVFGGWLLELLEYDRLMDIFNSGADEATLTNFMMEHVIGILVMFAFLLFVVVSMIVGTILFIVFRKRFTLEKGQISLPKGKRFQVVILNVGMILYCLYWIGMIVYQLVA